MQLLKTGVAALALAIMAGTAVAGDECGDRATACGPAKTATTARVNSKGKATGRFDTAMSGVCRFGCATKIKYRSGDVLGQPGARTGLLTQCPVSGVVFTVDADRPHVRIGGDEYVTCCEGCAKKLERDPRHYLKV